jgi:hypothetical protein
MPTNNERDKLMIMFQTYLKSKPNTWKALFETATKIAFFIKYIDRENIDKAYTNFTAMNSDQEILEMLKIVMNNYQQPFVQPDVSLTTINSIDEFLQAFLNAARTNLSIEMQLMARIYGEWMVNRKNKLGIPMPPRNTQMILVMLIIEWIKNKTIRKKLIAQVGTGEGKSLIIAMLCIYFVKVLDKKVHVLENNIGLLERDCASFVDFFRQFGISVGNCGKNFSDFADKDVCYCLRRTLLHFYRQQTFEGKNAFKMTFLINDEVDELIVDGDQNIRTVKLDAEMTRCLKQCFDALDGKIAVDDAVKNSATYADAVSAYNDAKKKVEGVDYELHADGLYYLLNDRFQIEKHTYCLSLEYINYKRSANYTPKILTNFFYQSMPYMMLQYEAIIGLTGANLSPAEKKFVSETYLSSFVTVPTFLNTCDGVEKESSALIDNRVYLFDKTCEQYSKILQLAINLAV